MILGALLGGWFAFWIVPAGVMIGWIVLGLTDLSWLPAQWLSGLLAAGELVLENIVLCIAICTMPSLVCPPAPPCRSRASSSAAMGLRQDPTVW